MKGFRRFLTDGLYEDFQIADVVFRRAAFLVPAVQMPLKLLNFLVHITLH